MTKVTYTVSYGNNKIENITSYSQANALAERVFGKVTATYTKIEAEPLTEAQEKARKARCEKIAKLMKEKAL